MNITKALVLIIPLLTVALSFPVVTMAMSPEEEVSNPATLSADRPDGILRRFLIAAENHDLKQLKTLIVPVSDADFRCLNMDLFMAQPKTENETLHLINMYSTITIRVLKIGDSFITMEGEKRSITAEQVGLDRALLPPEGVQTAISLRRINSRWLVDVGPVISHHKIRIAYRNAAEGKPLSTRDREHLMGDKFRTINHVAALPTAVRAYFGISNEEGSHRLVDPGAKFDAGCTPRRDASHRRLVFAGVGDKYSFVYFEAGGIAHFWLLYLFRQQNDETEMVWGGDIPGNATNLEMLRANINREFSKHKSL